MTAGAGILHEEFHSDAFAVGAANWKWCSCGLTFNEGQNDHPGLSSITRDVIPTVTLPDDAGVVRVIAGRYEKR